MGPDGKPIPVGPDGQPMLPPEGQDQEQPVPGQNGEPGLGQKPEEQQPGTSNFEGQAATQSLDIKFKNMKAESTINRKTGKILLETLKDRRKIIKESK
jgi:hypothetical protein